MADIENGSIPSIHKLFSLAICLRVSLHDLLFAFGIEAEEIDRLNWEATVEAAREKTNDGAHREYMRKWRATRVNIAMGAAAGA